MDESTKLFLVCGFLSGFNAVCFGSPLDCVTTRQMNNPAKYKSPIDCAYKMLVNEGPQVFYKGFIPNVARLGSFNMILFLSLETLRKKLNL